MATANVLRVVLEVNMATKRRSRIPSSVLAYLALREEMSIVSHFFEEFSHMNFYKVMAHIVEVILKG